MAVIREKRQYRNQRIGVVRIDTGEAQLWNTVANAADNLTQQAFKAAATEAEKKGKEFGQSISESSLRTIDPETGKPQAYQPPSSFGTIAQAAYEETLDRRYVRSVEREIKDKANETYLKYQFDPQGVEKYSQTMEDYVGNMVKNANGRFQTMVRDTGAAYIASTKFNLMQKRNLRLKEAEQVAQSEDARDAASMIEAMAANVDFNLPESQGHRDINDIYNEGIAGQKAALEAGFISNAQYNSNITVMRQALPRAMLSKMVNFDAVYETEDGNIVQMNSDAALAIENAVASGKMNDEIPLALRTQVEKVLSSESFEDDRSNLLTHITSLRTDLQAREGGQAKLTKVQQAAIDIDNGRAVNGSDPVTRDGADIVLAKSSPNLQGQERPDLISYIRSPDSVNDPALRKLIVSGVIPSSFLDAFDNAYNLVPMKAVELQTILQHWETFSNLTLGANAKANNMLIMKGGLNAEEDAFFRSLSYLTKVKGSENIIELAAGLKNNLQNKELVNDSMLRIFGSLNDKATKGSTVLNTYLNQKFGDDYTAKQYAEPVIKYMATSGMNFKQIDKSVNDMFEVNYGDTEGIVIDRNHTGRNKSLFSISKILPNTSEQQIFIREVGLLLKKEFPDQGLVFSKKPVGVDPTKIVKLVPITANALEPDIIPVEVEVQGQTQKQTIPIMSYRYMAAVQDENGELRFLANENGPLIVDTSIAKDPIAASRAFLKGQKIQESEKKVKRKKQIELFKKQVADDAKLTLPAVDPRLM